MKRTLLSFVVVVSLGCDLLPNANADNISKPSISRKDSITVRTFLDSNGLFELDVHDVVRDDANGVPVIGIGSVSIDTITLVAELSSLPDLCQLIFVGNIDLCGIRVSPDFHPSKDLEIALNANNFTQVPLELLTVPKIKTINLMFNQISTLPPEIMSRPDLELLIRYNRICQLPDSIAEFMDQNDSLWRLGQECL